MVVWRQRPKIHIWLKTDQITLRCANSTLVTSVCAIGKDAGKSGHLPFLSKGAGKSGLLSFLQARTICGEQAFFFSSIAFSVQITWPLSLKCVVVDLK